MSRGNPPQALSGSFRLFHVAGVSVFIHWSWFIVAAYEFQFRSNTYSSKLWNVAEYLALFGIVLLHEFGHAMACRQVGGTADRIVLWPLGGVAFVNPPPRPAALLWSIVAGPLVNFLLLPVLFGVSIGADLAGVGQASPDVAHFLEAIAEINLLLLVFNLLPVYPLDGGQILQSLLWFVIGRVWSLLVVSVIGLAVGAVVVVAALWDQNAWLAIVAFFVAFQSLAGFGRARALAAQARLPRRKDAACPLCGSSPLIGPYWRCEACGAPFDAFEHVATCPQCGHVHFTTACPDCRRSSPITEWFAPLDHPSDAK